MAGEQNKSNDKCEIDRGPRRISYCTQANALFELVKVHGNHPAPIHHSYEKDGQHFIEIDLKSSRKRYSPYNWPTEWTLDSQYSNDLNASMTNGVLTISWPSETPYSQVDKQ